MRGVPRLGCVGLSTCARAMLHGSEWNEREVYGSIEKQQRMLKFCAGMLAACPGNLCHSAKAFSVHRFKPWAMMMSDQLTWSDGRARSRKFRRRRREHAHRLPPSSQRPGIIPRSPDNICVQDSNPSSQCSQGRTMFSVFPKTNDVLSVHQDVDVGSRWTGGRVRRRGSGNPPDFARRHPLKPRRKPRTTQGMPRHRGFVRSGMTQERLAVQAAVAVFSLVVPWLCRQYSTSQEIPSSSFVRNMYPCASRRVLLMFIVVRRVPAAVMSLSLRWRTRHHSQVLFRNTIFWGKPAPFSSGTEQQISHRQSLLIFL